MFVVPLRFVMLAFVMLAVPVGDTVRDESVPTDVREDAVTPEARVLPVSVPAGAVIEPPRVSVTDPVVPPPVRVNPETVLDPETPVIVPETAGVAQYGIDPFDVRT